MQFVGFQFYFNFVAIILSLVTFCAYRSMEPVGAEKEQALKQRAKGVSGDSQYNPATAFVVS